jgi:hypothetical protein
MTQHGPPAGTAAAEDDSEPPRRQRSSGGALPTQPIAKPEGRGVSSDRGGSRNENRSRRPDVGRSRSTLLPDTHGSLRHSG